MFQHLLYKTGVGSDRVHRVAFGHAELGQQLLGNQRIGWMAMVTFFGLNGVAFEPPEAEAVVAMLDLASGDLPEAAFIAWVGNSARSPD